MSASALAGTAKAARPAATVSVALNPASIVADGSSTSTATATVKDAQGNVLPNRMVSFSSSDPGEKITSTSPDTATITSSKTVGAVTITAIHGALKGTATLTQTVGPPGPPATVLVALNPASIVANGSSTSTATATVIDAQGNVLPNQVVSFTSSDSGEKITSTSPETATITSSTTVGAATITAADGAATPGTATLTQVTGSPARITVQVTPGAIVANGVSTATATATVYDGQGNPITNDTITFSSSDPGQFFGPVSNGGNGTYSAQVRSSTRVGAATITATDPSHASAQTTLTQAAGPSSTSLIATPSTLVTNQVVTLLATVTASTGSPSGTITFYNGIVPIPGCAVQQIMPSSTAASCQTSFEASTPPSQLAAVFTAGPTSTAPGSTGTSAVIVNKDSSSVSLAVPGSVEKGQVTTYTASVAPPGSRPGPALPSGWVEFFDNGQPVSSCLHQPLISESAKCSVQYRALGEHTITASYSGDGNFTGSVFSPHSIAVVPVPVHISGTIASTMQWEFFFTLRYTTIRRFSVISVPAAASVIVVCHGRGCAFRKHIATIAKPKGCGHRGRRRCPTTGTVPLAAAFKKHHLGVGTMITVVIERPNWVGKYYKFVIRRGSPPHIQIECLAPGAARPGVGC